ncbi:hypothetical protein CARUB_v10002992mg [Capsella rubella]|uniref:F-box domain-containing protein n=1 Tax=Capsella rubella TaxID=81985 RepID=R0HEZ9_9BRAS|nr:hypothetical protein CARUB_v10002992mg [Capsella rubella]
MSTSQSKKRKTEENSQSLENLKEMTFDDVPLDLAMEIFMRLPVKSVARCLLLSKFWTEVIRSRRFITSFEVRSLLQPRLLVVFILTDTQRNCEDWYFFSLSSSSSTTSYLSRVTCPLPDSVYHSHYVNGLISIGYGLEKRVANPSTALPRVKTTSTVPSHCFFGYDPVNDEYKLLVLCMKEKKQLEFRHDRYQLRILQRSSRHQVVTLGAKRKRWRKIDYRTPHGPVLNSVCIDGVLYYVAFTGADMSQLSLMRFDLESEELDLFTSLSVDFMAESLHGSTLMNYKGKVALATKSSVYKFEVWVLDQHAKTHGWLKKSFVITGTKKILKQHINIDIIGTTHTGEFILAPRCYSNEFYVIHFNPDTDGCRTVKVELHGDYGFKYRETKAMVFLDYVESVRLL